MDRNLVQGPTSRFNRLRNWFNNLSRRVKIGSILTSFAALVAIVLSFAQLWQIMHPKKPPPPPINAELQKLGVDDELELTVSRIDYLRDTGKSTEGYSHKELQEFGLLVNTDADIEGLKDRELTLEYTLYNSSNDIRVPERSNKVADKIEPAASNDNERLTAFVPYPPEAGEYFTTLKLYDQNGVVLDELDSEPFTVFYAGPQPPEDPTVVLKKLYDTDNTSFLCSDCIPQTDNTQALAIDVPSEWRDVDGRGWSLQGESIIGPSFSASPNLDDFLETPNTPGVQFFASSVIANTWNYLDQYANESGSCQHEGRHNYNDGLYSGHYDVWENCGTRDTVVVNLLAWSQSETVSLYFTFVSVQVTGETDIEAANAIFNSFDVVGSLPSQSVSPSASASASATSTSSAAPGTTGITAPNNVGSSNQDRTSIEGPSTADLEAEAEEAV